MKQTTKFFRRIGFTVAFLLTLATLNVSAATLTVTNTNDTGAGSLRAALTQANANAQADTIVFDPSVFNSARTITLAGELTIESDGASPGRLLTISGPGANLLTISGGNASRIFYLKLSSSVTMSGMTLRDGRGNVNADFDAIGGAILSDRNNLTMRNMVVRNNSTVRDYGGICLNSVNGFAIYDSLITENAANSIGGIGGSTSGVPSDLVLLRNTVISNNSVLNQIGGASFASGTLTMENCQITGNRSGLDVGGVNNVGGLNLFQITGTVTDTTISNNSAGGNANDGTAGAIGGVSVNTSSIIFRRITVAGNRAYAGFGGGMYLRTGGSSMTVIDSTISGNQVFNPTGSSFSTGGGISTEGGTGQIFVINTTVANNVAQAGYGGGISNFADGLFVINSTIAGNSAPGNGPGRTGINDGGGGGIYNAGGTRIQNTVVANNTGRATDNYGPNVAGTVISNGYNLIGNTANASGFGAAGDRLNINPLLGALQSNGGTTQTIAPQTGSPAINAGNNLLAVDQIGQLLPFDQRGRCFGRFTGGTVDIGAFETGTVSRCNASRFDFDGDGRDDISVFRPSGGTWFLQQSQNGFTGIAFGASTDIIAPADYDGDGRTDIAVFRPSNGTWYLQQSSLGFVGIAFGQTGDVPAPSDYDGDGKADLAVFRPSSGTWYLLRSQLGFTSIQFGQMGDKPVAADYDGDGRADVAVNRGGVWYIQRSQLGFTGIQFGDANDRPTPADYDGDGKADVAVFRPSNGTWYLQQSTAGFTGIQFGLGTDVPVTADYDGDGRSDVAAFRNGTWYLRRSTQGFAGISFGTLNDRPAPAAFTP